VDDHHHTKVRCNGGLLSLNDLAEDLACSRTYAVGLILPALSPSSGSVRFGTSASRPTATAASRLSSPRGTSVVANYLRRAENIQPAPINAARLAEISFAEPGWIIRDMLPVGVHIPAGKPKKGKSRLALGACASVASGGRTCGVKVVREGTSPHLRLGGYRPRLHKRPKKVLGGRPAPERVYLETSWPRLHEGGATLLDDWLTSHPHTRLVVIGTLARIREPASGRNVYAEDRAHVAESKHGERDE
jgi:hypothetical protein